MSSSKTDEASFVEFSTTSAFALAAGSSTLLSSKKTPINTFRASSENRLAFRAATNVTARSRFRSLRAMATATRAADAVAFAYLNAMRMSRSGGTGHFANGDTSFATLS